MASDNGADDPREPNRPRKADHYRHEDGTTEVVFAVEDGRVLSIREYSNTETFRRAVADAEFVGEHEGVAELPGVEAFEDE